MVTLLNAAYYFFNSLDKFSSFTEYIVLIKFFVCTAVAVTDK